MIQGVRLVGNNAHIDIDREAHAANNRIIFDINGRYASETFAGTTFTGSSVVARTNDTVTIQINNQVNVGDTVRLDDHQEDLDMHLMYLNI